MPSGYLRVRVYAGTDPITGSDRYLRHTVPAGPTALEQAEATCRRLVTLIRANSTGTVGSATSA